MALPHPRAGRRRERRLFSVRLGIAVGFVLVITMPENGGAAGASLFVPPYAHSVVYTNDSTYPLLPIPCASGSIVYRPMWAPRTGQLSVGLSARASSNGTCNTGPNPYCGSQGFSCGFVGVASANAEFWIPLGRSPPAGLHNVTVNWTLDDRTTWNITHAHCPPVNRTKGGSSYCDVYATSYVTVSEVQVYDLTAGAVLTAVYPGLTFGNTSQWFYDKACSPSGCGVTRGSYGSTLGSYATNLSNMTKVPFYGVPGDSIAVGVDLVFLVGASVNADPAGWIAQASATLTLAGHGHGLFVRSVQVR